MGHGQAADVALNESVRRPFVSARASAADLAVREVVAPHTIVPRLGARWWDGLRRESRADRPRTQAFPAAAVFPSAGRRPIRADYRRYMHPSMSMTRAGRRRVPR